MPTKVLIAPLDWGLGHATRCISIIKALAAMPEVVLQLAASGAGHKLYAQLFPQLKLYELVGYEVRYGNTAKGFMMALLRQLPRILKVVKAEKLWLKELQTFERFDVIISDNRYGMHVAGSKNIFLTHQINILSGKGSFLDKIVARMHRRILKPFDEIFIVDNEGSNALAPRLSQPKLSFPSLKFLGLLSQFETLPPSANKQQVLVLLSGPEPMRTHLQEILLKQLLPLSQYQVDFVMGTPLSGICFPPAPHIRLHGLVGTAKLSELLTKSNLVVCRSGYSTIMDLVAVGRKALLIPTPGQTEQEYLALELAAKGWVHTVAQDEVDLEKDIKLANDEIGFNPVSLTINSLVTIISTCTAKNISEQSS